MDPVLKAILLSWDWRADVLIVLALAGTLYTLGWRRLRRRSMLSAARNAASSPSPLTTKWRLVAYLSGLFFVLIALLSPIDVLASQLFTMHMIQHLLLIMIAPPLLLLANPLPVILWGLPNNARRAAGRAVSGLIAGDAPFRRALKSATSPGVTWLIWVISILGWHDVSAYNLALRSALAHDLEHLSFFTAGMLYWWHVIGAGPRIHRQLGFVGRIAFSLSIIPPNMVAGVAIAFASEPIYAYTSGFLGMTSIYDQRLGGMIMWVPGSMMYIVAALILAGQLLGQEERKPALPISSWASEEKLAAPGLKHST